MNKKTLPQPIGIEIQEPIYFPRKDEICRRLDEFYKTPGVQKNIPPSTMFLGALYGMQQTHRKNNSDWISQVAHSLREIFYGLGLNWTSAFKDYGSTQSEAEGAQNIGRYYNFISDIAHHNFEKAEKSSLIGGSEENPVRITPEVFEKVVLQFGEIVFSVLRRQVDAHSEIDNIVKATPKSGDQSSIKELVSLNPDAHQYFFFKADERWLEWLWKNGFLDVIKEKAPDPNSYGFRTPELHYLVNVAEKKPDIVADVICSVEINLENFNPEVVDQFSRIASKLPARSLKKIVKKIKNEKWIKLMGKYTQYGFEYADMFETLHKASDFQSMLVLTEAVLLVRSNEEIKERKISYSGDDVFYIHDLVETKVFTYLAEMPDKYLVKTLSIVINAFTEAIKDEGGYLLMDEDFFTLNLSSITGHTYREELKFLTATIISLVRKMFGDNNFDQRKLYTKHFVNLPKNQITRRLNLFVLCLNPKLFITELKEEYFRLFEVKKPLEVLYGAEYERALKVGFAYLTEPQKREYVAKVFDLFSNPKDEDDKRWKRHYASCILSTISEDIIKQEIALAKRNEFKIDPNYQPEPSVGHMRGGTVTPRSPISLDDFSKLSINDVVNRLKGELSPQELQKRYKNDDFLNPRDADGVSEQLKSDIKNRLDDYLGNATLFFDRDKLIPHYTYSFLRGVKEALAENRESMGNRDYEELFKLLSNIKESGKKNSFSKATQDSEGRWLSGWNSVNATISDLIEELIQQKDKKTLLDFKKYRERVLIILEYLLDYNDPIPEDEKLKTAKSTVKRPNESEYSISDPFSIAINSVRGQAFQTLLHFIYQDASNSDKVKLADDVKTLYDKLLKKENTRAIMFMFGHYLPSFHFRDMKWTRSRFSEIFESDQKDKYLRLAAWEGYLSNNLYNELFFESYFQKLYSKNITLKLSYPKQKFFKDPHEAIAIHLALAFVHYEDFGFENKLFKAFLDKASTKQLSEFISFLGGSYIAGENYHILKDEKYFWRTQRVKDFWDLMLSTKGDSPALKEFGTWIEVANNVFEASWLAGRINETLDATKGDLEWDYGLVKSIEKFASDAPGDALKILEKHFLAAIGDEQKHFPIQADKEWYNAFKILYGNISVRRDTYSLINRLIEKGGRQFWILEDIVKNNQGND